MRAILAGCAVLAALAVVAPAHVTSILQSWSAPPPAGEPPTSEPQAAAPQRPGARSERLEVRAAANGHFYVAASVNGARVALMVDTGATIVALRQSDAEAAGIRVVPGDFVVPLATANAVVHAAAVEIDHIAVDRIEMDRVAAVVLPDDRLGTSLLGSSFLNRLQRFEIAGNRLIFEN